MIISADIEDNLIVIESSLKKQKVEVTLSSLTKLKSKIKSNEKEMKQMLEKDIRYLENYKDEQELIFRCIDEHGDSYSDDDEDWKPKMNKMCEGPADKMLHFLKLCLKSISGHSESFWKKNFR